MKDLTRSFIQLTIKTPRWHALWLNTLSFLEHIGSRKIIKSQDSAYLTDMVLEHIAEEARHALFFKRLANKISPQDCKNYESRFLILADRTEAYFQTLDQKIHQELQTNTSSQNLIFFTYLYVTLLVEERAMVVYEVYEELLNLEKKNGNTAIPQTMTLKPILTEEQGHLDQMLSVLAKEDANFKENHQKFQKFEAQLYQDLIHEMTSYVAQEQKQIELHV